MRPQGAQGRGWVSRVGRGSRVGAGRDAERLGRAEGCPHGATPNLSVPICVAKRGSPKVAWLDIPDLAARGEEGQKRTAASDVRKPRTLLLRRSARGQRPQRRLAAAFTARPGPALSAESHRRAPAGRGPNDRQKQSTRKINSSSLELFFFSLWGSVQGTSGFCTYFFVVVKLTSREEKGGGSCKGGGWVGRGREAPAVWQELSGLREPGPELGPRAPRSPAGVTEDRSPTPARRVRGPLSPRRAAGTQTLGPSDARAANK